MPPLVKSRSGLALKVMSVREACRGFEPESVLMYSEVGIDGCERRRSDGICSRGGVKSINDGKAGIKEAPTPESEGADEQGIFWLISALV